jgi:hypothetical protein
MSSWSPKSQVNDVSTGSSASYLSNVSNGGTTASAFAAPSSYSYGASAPAPSAPAVSPVSSWSGDYMSNLSGGSASPGEVKKSYGMTSWSPNQSSPVASVISVAESSPKKSYSMSSWSPKSQVNDVSTGSGASYLSNVSNGGTTASAFAAPSSYSYGASAPAPSAPAVSPVSSWSGDYMSDLSAGITTGFSPNQPTVTFMSSRSVPPKKSYAMSNWSPKSQVNEAGTGSNADYMSDLSAGITAVNGLSPPSPLSASPGSVFLNPLDESSTTNLSDDWLPRTELTGGNIESSEPKNGAYWGSMKARSSPELDETMEPPMSPYLPRTILESDPVPPPPNESIHAFVGSLRMTSYGPSKWSPDQGVPRRIL